MAWCQIELGAAAESPAARGHRYLSCALHLDYDSMAGADKFGNVFVTRMPADISLQVEDDPTGGKFAAVGGGTLGAADHKVEPVINFHLGDLVMSMQLTALQSGGQEVCCGAAISSFDAACTTAVDAPSCS